MPKEVIVSSTLEASWRSVLWSYPAKESKIVKGRLQHDHVNLMMAIPPKYSVAQVGEYIQGKRAIHIALRCLGQRENYRGMHFWARGKSELTGATNEEIVQTDIYSNSENADRHVKNTPSVYVPNEKINNINTIRLNRF